MSSKERKESENIMASATYGLTQNYRGTKQLGDIEEKHTHSNDIQLDLRKSEGKLKDRQALNFLLTKHNRNYATDKQVQARIVQHLRSLRRARRFQLTAIRYNRFPPTHKRQHDPKSLIFCGIDEDKRIRVRRAPRPEDPSSEPEPDAIQNIERASSTPEPVSNPPHQSEPEPEAESSWPEPGPNWPAAIKQWRVAWSLHVYGFATIFTVLAFYSALEMARLCSSKKPKTALKVTTSLMISIFSTTHAIGLYVDPYGSAGLMNAIATRLLILIGKPCIISALSLLLLVLIDTTKVDISPPKFQRVLNIVLVVVVHVVLLVATEFIVTKNLAAKHLILLCQLYYIIVGAFLSIGFAKVGYKISSNIVANGHRDKKMRRLQVMIFLSSACGVLMIAINIYSAAGVFGIYSDVQFVGAWPWWGLVTSERVTEVLMCVILLRINCATYEKRRLSPLSLLPWYRERTAHSVDLPGDATDMKPYEHSAIKFTTK